MDSPVIPCLSWQCMYMTVSDQPGLNVQCWTFRRAHRSECLTINFQSGENVWSNIQASFFFKLESFTWYPYVPVPAQLEGEASNSMPLNQGITEIFSVAILFSQIKFRPPKNITATNASEVYAICMHEQCVKNSPEHLRYQHHWSYKPSTYIKKCCNTQLYLQNWSFRF